MKQQQSRTQRPEKKIEKQSKADKIYAAFAREKRRAEARKKVSA